MLVPCIQKHDLYISSSRCKDSSLAFYKILSITFYSRSLVYFSRCIHISISGCSILTLKATRLTKSFLTTYIRYYSDAILYFRVFYSFNIPYSRHYVTLISRNIVVSHSCREHAVIFIPLPVVFSYQLLHQFMFRSRKVGLLMELCVMSLCSLV